MIPDLTDQLAAVAELIRTSRKQRDQLIVQAHLAGASLREIARAVDLSHVGVKKIVERTT